MYMPNLTPRDAHRLWLDAKYENEADSSIASLSSYSPAYPGSLNMIRVNQSKQKEFFRPVNTEGKIDPALNVTNLMNHEYLESFSKLGYTTLKPIGFNKTMQQMDEERRELEESKRNNNAEFYGNEEAVNTSEPNRADNNNSVTNELSFDAMLGENTRSANNTTSMNSNTSANVNVNTNNTDSIAASDQFQFENDQDFMAEDEEYQDDHSISMDSDSTNTRGLVRSNTFFSNPLSSATTPATSAYESRSYYRHVSTGSNSGMSNLRNEIRISSTSSEYE